MADTTLDGHRAEHRTDRGPERVAAVEDDEHALLDVQAAVDAKAPRPKPLERFPTHGLGFRFSDRMAPLASWWHCDADHHGMAITLAARNELPHGAMIELCSDLAEMPPTGDYQPRNRPSGPGTVNQWSGPPPPRFLLTGFPIAEPGTRSGRRTPCVPTARRTTITHSA